MNTKNVRRFSMFNFCIMKRTLRDCFDFLAQDDKQVAVLHH